MDAADKLREIPDCPDCGHPASMGNCKHRWWVASVLHALKDTEELKAERDRLRAGVTVLGVALQKIRKNPARAVAIATEALKEHSASLDREEG